LTVDYNVQCHFTKGRIATVANTGTKKQNTMQEKKIFGENVVEVSSLHEALSLDTEEKDINLIIIENVSTQGNWKPAQEQNHIPKAIAQDHENYGKIIVRVGLGYHYLYDTLDGSWIKAVDTDTTSIIKKYLAEK
jgi:hypothetical protein